ncbi:MAG TPA: FHA domain-containing protein [Acidobacteriota bacterium]|nr:FHA domain-containing protein [Acidobacteriota bacterium]
MAKLIVYGIQPQPVVIPLRGRFTIGRDRNCTLRLEDACISRLQAVIETSGGEAVICDGGSSNGTWLNGQLIQFEEKLSDGDEVIFGGGIRATFTHHSTLPHLAPSQTSLARSKPEVTSSLGPKPNQAISQSVASDLSQPVAKIWLAGFGALLCLISFPIIWFITQRPQNSAPLSNNQSSVSPQSPRPPARSNPINEVQENSKPTPTAPVSASYPDVQQQLESVSAVVTHSHLITFSSQLVTDVQACIPSVLVSPVELNSEEKHLIQMTFTHRGIQPLVGGLILASRQLASGSSPQSRWGLPPKILRSYRVAITGSQTSETDLAALYIRDVCVVFDAQDIWLALACYGQPLWRVATVRALLETKDPDRQLRTDLWKCYQAGIINQEEWHQLCWILAASTIAEHPAAYGLTGKPLSAQL